MNIQRIVGSLSFVVVILGAMYIAKIAGLNTLTKEILFTLGVLTVYSIVYERVTTRLARKKAAKALNEKYGNSN